MSQGKRKRQSDEVEEDEIDLESADLKNQDDAELQSQGQERREHKQQQQQSYYQDYLQNDSYKAMISLLPNTNIENALNAYHDQRDTNLGICLPCEDKSEDRITREIVKFFRKRVENDTVGFFKSLREDGEDDSLTCPFFLLGTFTESLESTKRPLIKSLWLNWLQMFFQVCLKDSMGKRGFPKAGLMYPDESDPNWEQMTDEEKQLSQHMMNIIEYESENLPTTLFEFVHMFRTNKKVTFPLPERKVIVMTDILKNAIYANRESSTYSFQVLTLFREFYRPFVTKYMKTIILYGGEMLPASVSELFRNFFQRLIHIYYPMSSIFQITSTTSDFFLFSRAWFNLIPQPLIIHSLRFYHSIIIKGDMNFQFYRDDMRRLFRDLLCVKPLYHEFSKNINESQSNHIHLKNLERVQPALTKFISHYIEANWCKNRQTWIDYWKKLVLPFTYTRTDKLDEARKINLLLQDSKQEVKNEDDDEELKHELKLQEIKNSNKSAWEQFRLNSKAWLDSNTVDTLASLSQQAIEAQMEREKQDNENDFMIKNSILTEHDTTINKIFTPLVVFFSREDSDAYNINQLAAFCRAKVFKSKTSISRLAQAKITSSPLSSNTVSGNDVIDLHATDEDDPRFQFEKDLLDDTKLRGINDYSFIKKRLKKNTEDNKDSGLDKKHEKKINIESKKKKKPIDKENDRDVKMLNHFLETEDVPFLLTLPLCQGAIYHLTMPIKVNGKIVPSKTRLKLLNFIPVRQQNLALLDDTYQKQERNNVDSSREIAAWLRDRSGKKKKKQSKKEQLQELQFEKDASFFDWTADEYKESEVYKQKMAKIIELQQELNQENEFIQIPFMSSENEQHVFPLNPFQFEVKLQSRSFFICQFPLMLSYSISVDQLKPHPISLYKNLSISIKELNKHPLIIYSLLENCEQNDIEFLHEVPSRKNIDTLFQGKNKNVDEYVIWNFIELFLKQIEKVAKTMYQ